MTDKGAIFSPPTLSSNNGGGGNGGGAGEADPRAVPPALVGAMVPAQILHEDEIVLILTKPSLLFIFYSSFPFLVVAGLLAVLAAQISYLANLSASTVVLIAVIAGVCRLVWALLVWTSHVYMLTNRRIVTIKGVINVHIFQANLRKLQKTDIYRPIGQRIFQTGTLGFSTAAAAGGPDSTWVMINRPQETHEQIVAAINKAK